MIPIEDILKPRFSTAIGLAFGSEYAGNPMVQAADPKFADYQCNAALALARRLSQPPRKVAEQILTHLLVEDLCEAPQIAGPGFINLRLRPAWLAQQCAAPTREAEIPARAGVEGVAVGQTVVVDYGGPNLAKEMHVGHLRSAVIGDAIARVLAFLGYGVVRQNHVGDFGTQFGMLIRQARELAAASGNEATIAITDLDACYRQAVQRDREDPVFAAQARQEVVKLQQADPETVRLWQGICQESRRHCRDVFEMLGITLSERDIRAESYYKDRLAPMVERLRRALELGGEGPKVGLAEVFDPQRRRAVDVTALTGSAALEASGALAGAEAMERVAEAVEEKPPVVMRPFAAESNGAWCVFLPGYVDQEHNPVPLIVRKADGAYLYAATDLAALYFRIQEAKTTSAEQAPWNRDWRADRVIYVTDARQSQHFAMLFDTVRAAHWDRNPITGAPVRLEHAAFGSLLGEDGKPFKTRSGESIKLLELLTEAVDKAAAVVAQKNPLLPEATRRQVAKAVGIGAVKYSDLRQDRTSDYVFSWSRMLALDGNTGPYLQYAYTRIQSILRKADAASSAPARGEHAGRSAAAPLQLETPQEIALARRLLQFAGVVHAVGRDLKPHYLCTYLYELAVEFSAFYEGCPVLQAGVEELRFSRLRLCRLTAAVLRVGLQELLGIAVLDEM